MLHPDSVRGTLRGSLAVLLVAVVVGSLAAPASARPAASATVLSDFPVSVEFRPNDPWYSDQWGLPMIDAPEAWDVTLGDHTAIVAVVDTGVGYTDNDLAGNMWTNTDGSHGWDVIGDSNNPMDRDSPTYHGTGVAGVIGAVTDNGVDIAGVAQARIMALRALDSSGQGSSHNVSVAIRWAADHNAKIINLSLGTNQTFGVPTDISLAVNYAWNRGALILAAAGNSGTATLDYPAALPNVVSVAAVGPTGTRASFSNYGQGLSLSAPGVNIRTLDPDPSATLPTHALTGTSLATPFVAGVAALILSMDPSLTNVELWNILNATATPVGPRYTTDYGWGIVNARSAIDALNQPFISVNAYPSTVARSSTFSVTWSVLGPAGLAVSDTHVLWGTDPADLGNATAPQTGTTRMDYSTTGLSMPGSADAMSFRVVAVVNGTQYESRAYTVTASNLPDFLFVLINVLSSNLLYLFLFIIALAAVVAFVPQRRRARARRIASRSRSMPPAAYQPSAGPPPAPPPAQPQTVRAMAGPPPPIEFVRPSAPPVSSVAPPPPPPAAAKKRCPNCGTLVGADNLFCFFCGNPFR
ncbi:MAG TPA: S8 family serine peptidase [Thermoplasmata archaeon]